MAFLAATSEVNSAIRTSNAEDGGTAGIPVVLESGDLVRLKVSKSRFCPRNVGIFEVEGEVFEEAVSRDLGTGV
jgi:hypothetical protein